MPLRIEQVTFRSLKLCSARPGRSYALRQAAKTTLFAAASAGAGSKKSRAIFSNRLVRFAQAVEAAARHFHALRLHLLMPSRELPADDDAEKHHEHGDGVVVQLPGAKRLGD